MEQKNELNQILDRIQGHFQRLTEIERRTQELKAKYCK